MISIENIKFAYSREVVLDGFTLQFDKGGIYGLLGKNGTGKSTLLYLMMGLLRPQKGKVTVDGIDTTLRRPEVLSEMFLVPEEYDLPAISLSAYVKAIKPFYPRFSEDLLKQWYETGDTDLPENVLYQSRGPLGSGTYLISGWGQYFCYQ
jgi:ABC-2 type transport system ATP-binding protein